MSRRSRRRRESEVPNAMPLTSLASLLRPLSFDLREVEDRRTAHPLGDLRPVRQISGHPVKPHVARQADKPSARVPTKIQFAQPASTAICVRRGVRKEVLHALRKTGRGSSRKPKRRNWNSEVTC